MGFFKELDIRLRGGGDDAVAAFNEYVTIAGTVSADTGMGFIPANSFKCLPNGYKMYSIGWIPVSERLPDENRVLIFCPLLEPREIVGARRYSPSDGWSVWVTDDGQELGETEPTHWMPLPSPPEVKR